MAGQADIGALVVTLEAQTAAFNTGMAQATKSLNSFGAASSAIESQFAGVQGAFVKFNNATAALQNGMALVSRAFGSLRGFTDMREQLEVIESSFNSVLGSGERAADMMERVRKISNELGSSLPSTASAVRRMAIGLTQLGSSNAEIDRITTTFLKLGAIGGSIEEATAAIFQFSQALGSGTLRGDELISLLERQPLIAMEVAKYLQKIGLSADGSVASLRKLASDGKVTSVILRDALLDAEKAIADKYAKMPLKISQVLNQISNLFTGFAVDLNKTFEINETTVATLTGLRNAIRDVIVPFGEFLKFLKEAGLLSAALTVTLGALTIAFRTFLTTALIAAIPVIVAFTAAFAAAVVALKVPLAIIGTIAAALYALSAQLGLNAVSFDKWWINIVEKVPGVARAFKKSTETVGQYIGRLNAQMEEAETNAALFAMGASKNLSGDFVVKSKPISEFQKQSKEALESFRKGLVTAQIEASLLTTKINDLKAAIASTKDDNLKKTYTKQLEELEAQTKTAFELWELSVKKIDFGQTTADIEKQIVVYKDLANATEDLALKTSYLAKAKGLQEGLDDLVDPLAKFKRELEEAGKASEFLVAKLFLIDEAVKNGLDPNKAKKMKDALLEVDSAAKEIGKGIEDALQRNASNAVNNFIDNIGEAKFSFTDFAESVIKDIAKMIVQLLLIKPLMESVKYGLGAMGFGVASASTSSGASTASVAAFGGADTASGSSGYGSRFGVAMQDMSVPSLSGRMPQYMPMAAQSETVVNVYNSADATVKTAETTNADGSKQIDIMIEKKVKELFGSGSMDKSMRSSYGLVRSAA